METETHIWNALPDNLLCSILARLPVRDVARMRIVCKRWRDLLPAGDALQRIDPNFSVNSIPAFLIQLYRGPRHHKMCVIELAHGGSDINIYKCPFPSDRIVVNASHSICLSMRKGDRLDLSLYNPATRNWRQLPRPAHNDPIWDFSAMTFDATLRRCTVLLGENDVGDGSGTLKVLDIYDSESNAWTRVSTKVPGFHVQPVGKGLYSNGKFYWRVKRNGIYFVVAFDIAKRSWTEITLPEVCRISYFPASLYLSGCDGRVVLVLQGEKRGSICMWRLNDGRKPAEWHELHDICISECHKFYSVAVNSEWVMAVDREMEVYLCNLEQKSTQKVSLPGCNVERPPRSILSSHPFLSAFESNNVWWP